jgi:hypothetical protein
MAARETKIPDPPAPEDIDGVGVDRAQVVRNLWVMAI